MRGKIRQREKRPFVVDEDRHGNPLPLTCHGEDFFEVTASNPKCAIDVPATNLSPVLVEIPGMRIVAWRMFLKMLRDAH